MKFSQLALVGTAAAAQSQVELDRIKLEEIVGGVLKGALHAEGFDDINSCIGDAETVFKDAETAVQDFKAGGATNVIKGLQEVGQILQVVQSGMKDCSNIKADWSRLEGMVKAFSNPTSFAYHVGKDLIVNGKDIYGEIKTSITDYQEEKWGEFGYQVGEAAAKVILGDAPVKLGPNPNAIKIATILKGVIEAFGGHFSLDALLACIKQEDQAVMILDAAYKELAAAGHDKSIQELIGGVIAAVMGIKQVQAGLPTCASIDTQSWDYAQFSSITDIAANPVKYFKPVAGDVLIDGLPILWKANRAVHAYTETPQDLHAFGEQLGGILRMATDGAKKQQLKADKLLADKATSVAVGFMKGAKVGTFNFDALLECIYVADNAAQTLEAGIEEIGQAYKDKSVKEALIGAVETVSFIKSLQQVIPICATVESETANWSDFDRIVDVIETPMATVTVAKNIIMNGHTITNDMQTAFEALRAADYEGYGMALGDTFARATDVRKADLFLY